MVDTIKSRVIGLDISRSVNLVQLRSEISNLMGLFKDAGAQELDLPSLLDPNVLIDLYGEDIRSRAYMAINLFGEKKILRPDFTVPIVQMHIASKKKVGKYSYAGNVWRAQPFGVKRPSEHFQVGFENFHENESIMADAAVFNLFLNCTAGLDLNIELGDMAIIRAIVNCLDISNNKKDLLLRHLWRPDRFKQLLYQLSSDGNNNESRKTLFNAIKIDKLRDFIKDHGPVIGQRSIREIIIRSKDLLREESEKPIPKTVVSVIEQIQSLRCPLSEAPTKIMNFSFLGNELGNVCDNLSRRIQALDELHIDIKKLNFMTNLARPFILQEKMNPS